MNAMRFECFRYSVNTLGYGAHHSKAGQLASGQGKAPSRGQGRQGQAGQALGQGAGVVAGGVVAHRVAGVMAEYAPVF